MLTVTDIFAGAGGSSTGMVAVPGVRVAVSANRTLTTKDGQRYRSTSYGPWEPIFPAQTCAGCGTEHPGGLPCDRQEGLW